MGLYLVELVTHSYVVADSEVEAHSKADKYSKDIINDNGITCVVAVKIINQRQRRLHDNVSVLSLDIIPYGGDGKTPIKDLIPLNS